LREKTYKHVILSIATTMILVSCSSASPAATSRLTTSPSLTPTKNPWLTPPGVTPAATVTPTPQPRGEDFKLLPWDKNDPYYEGVLDSDSSNPWGSKQFGLGLTAERWLRGTQDERNAIAWQMASLSPKGIALPGMRPGEDLLAFMIEDTLNGGHGTNDAPLDLFRLLHERINSLEHCLYQDFGGKDAASAGDEFLVVPNLFGDGRAAWVFFANQSCLDGAIYVLRQVGESYQVEKIRGWDRLTYGPSSYSWSLYSVGDTNGNARSEIVVETTYGASGDPQYWSQTLTLYEWDPIESAFVSQDIKVFGYGCDQGPCYGEWEFGPANAHGVRPLITRELFFTQYDMYLAPSETCPDLVADSKYLWGGARLVKQGRTVLPADSAKAECEILWAYKALELEKGENNLAMGILDRALLNWPEKMNSIWGPASQDYFRLRSGIWHDLRGEEPLATEILNVLTDRPSNANYHFASQLARKYLEIRSKKGIFPACQELEFTKDKSVFNLKGSSFHYLPLDKLTNEWGFSANEWSRGVDTFCDPFQALDLLARSVPFPPGEDIASWLLAAGIDAKTVRKLELPSSNASAWLIETTHKTMFLRLQDDHYGPSEEIVSDWWLLVSSPPNTSAGYLWWSSGNNSDQVPAVDHFQLGKHDQGILIKSEDEVSAFRIDAAGRLSNLLDEFLVDAYVDDNEIILIDTAYILQTAGVYAFHWDAAGQVLVKRRLNYDFEQAQAGIQNAMFHDEDYSRAIVLINEFLVQAPLEPARVSSCSLGICQYEPAFYDPYFRYLLAVAYELDGQPERARDTFFALSRDYSDNVFGIAASHRLAPVAP
jgi:hypothetical protein